MSQRVGMPMEQRFVSGEVVSAFRDRLANFITVNEGMRNFSILTNNAFNADVPFMDTQQTRIRITNQNHDISQLDKTYLTLEFEANCQLKGTKVGNAAPAEGKPYHWLDLALFVKNAPEIFRQLEVANMNVDTGYMQSEVSKESAMYGFLRPAEELYNMPHTHSSFEDVTRGRKTIAGGYFKCEAVKDGAMVDEAVYGTSATSGLTGGATTNNIVIKGVKIIVPITSLLAFQCFQDWIGALGDIVLKVFFNKNAFCYAFVDPYYSALNEVSKAADATAAATALTNLEKVRAAGPLAVNLGFTQVGQPTTHVTEYKDTSTVGAGVQLDISSLKCTKFKCDCYGFCITQEAKKQLYPLFTPSHPLIIPAQQIDVKHFPNGYGGGEKPDTSLYNSDFTYALHNVTDFIVVFPRNSNDVTTWFNPMAKNLQLRVDGKLYPNQQLDNTWDNRFYMQQYLAGDFDSFYGMNPDYKRSITTPISKYGVFLEDVSDFIWQVQAERNGNGCFFDGLETGNQNVNINLQFSPGPECKVGEHHNQLPPPQMFFVRDTYWTLDNENGLRYWKTGTPQAYASEEDPFAANATVAA